VADRLLRHTVEKCARCGESHSYALLVRDRDADAVPVFGGGGRTEVALVCPTTKQLFTQSVSNPEGAEILGPADPSQLSLRTAPAAPPGAAASDFAEWAKSSRQTATDYCKTMLTTSSGAIPVYFAVLKYLGHERVGSSAIALVGVVPPVLLLTAAMLFAIALRPRLALLTPDGFTQFRTQRLKRLDRYIGAGTAAFGMAVGLAVLIFLRALTAPGPAGP
jgi:hypothetical protein